MVCLQGAGAGRTRKDLLVSLVFVVFGGPGILGVYIPFWISRWREPAGASHWRWLGLVLIAIGLAPLAESIMRFVTQGKGTLSPSHPTETLVAQGFYRHVRNPMYLGMLAIIAGQAILFESWRLCIYLGCVAIGFHLFVVLYEEPALRKQYAAAYDEFCRRVPRWLPRLRYRT